jgi:hypothetical protein
VSLGLGYVNGEVPGASLRQWCGTGAWEGHSAHRHRNGLGKDEVARQRPAKPQCRQEVRSRGLK